MTTALAHVLAEAFHGRDVSPHYVTDLQEAGEVFVEMAEVVEALLTEERNACASLANYLLTLTTELPDQQVREIVDAIRHRPKTTIT